MSFRTWLGDTYWPSPDAVADERLSGWGVDSNTKVPRVGMTYRVHADSAQATLEALDALQPAGSKKIRDEEPSCEVGAWCAARTVEVTRDWFES